MTAVCCNACGHLTTATTLVLDDAGFLRFTCDHCGAPARDVPFEPVAKNDAFGDLAHA